MLRSIIFRERSRFACNTPTPDARYASLLACVQIHCRYRANERNEAKRKGRHTGTGACSFWRCTQCGVSTEMRKELAARLPR